MTEDQNQQSAAKNSGKQKPVEEFRYGGVRASIWAHESKHGTIHTTKLSRSFMKNDDWEETEYLGVKDIYTAILALEDAARFMLSRNGQSSTGTPPLSKPPGQANQTS